MTFGIKTIAGIATLQTRKGFFGTVEPLFGKDWGEIKLFRAGFTKARMQWTLEDVWTYAIGCHLGHALEFLVALLTYHTFFDAGWIERCAELQLGWVSKVVAYNLACEAVIPGCWHFFTYGWKLARGLDKFKFNEKSPYANGWDEHLRREVTFTTLGWLQSAGWQVLWMWLWASGRVAFYGNFFEYPAFSVFSLCFVTYWREIHFYFAHRSIHPWWDRSLGLKDGDIGAFLYRHAHSLHHKSYNPGPWSGLSMHPVEHLVYYSVAWTMPLFATLHPLAFLYCKFHADIAPIGGHDGFDEPSANGDFHYLHHAKFECNYGVPFPICFDSIFGTWVDYREVKQACAKSHEADASVNKKAKAG